MTNLRVNRCCFLLSLAIGFTLTCQPTPGTERVTQPRFVDVAQELGVNHVQSDAYGSQVMTGGVAVGDFDRDGLADLFFTRIDLPCVLYRNTGHGFVDVSQQAGFVDAFPANGVAAADVDNDGDQDLYVTASDGDRYRLFINDGEGRFSEEAAFRGVAVAASGRATRRGQGVAFADYDGDGFLDLLTTDHSRPTSDSGARLLRNLGSTQPGHFEDVTESAGLDVYRKPLAVADLSYRFTPQFADMDRDGHIDILIASDSRTSQLFWNQGDGTFVDGTILAGVGTDKSGMGSAIADYDHDGDFDWFVTAIFDTPDLSTQPGNRLYRNNGDRTFLDVTTMAGVRSSGWGWGTAFLDFDNNGLHDLIATNGFIGGSYATDRTTIWQGNADGRFSDVSRGVGIVDTGQGRGLAKLDFDSDGDLDVVIANYQSRPILYRNDGGNEARWLRVALQGTRSNRDGIGSIVAVIPDQNDQDFALTEQILSGESFLSSSEHVAHFGLGDRDAPVDMLEVFWPTSGLHQYFPRLVTNQLLTVREELIGDVNGDSQVDAADWERVAEDWGRAGDGLPADIGGPLGLPDGQVNEWDFHYWSANAGQHWGTRHVAPEVVASPLLGFAWLVRRALVSRRPLNRDKSPLSSLRYGRDAESPPSPRQQKLHVMRASPRIMMSLWMIACSWASVSYGVDVWLTTGDGSRRLAQQPDVVFGPHQTNGVGVAIQLDSRQTYQAVEGYGAALTDSAAWVLMRVLNEEQRNTLMQQLFSRELGIGISYVRLPLGASDFTASGYYTYNDMPEGRSDPDLENFSIKHDSGYILPILRQAQRINPELKVMATPWTAPAWMKTNRSLVGGELDQRWEAAYALYLTKCVEAFAAEGVRFDTLTVQNEPLHVADYPTMYMTPEQQVRLIGTHLGPLFANREVVTKILAYDHNWDDKKYPLHVLKDPQARSYLAGTAFHAYAGRVEMQSEVHAAFPDKDIYFTEISGGEWSVDFGENLVWNLEHIFIGSARHWSKSAILWNLALNEQHGPHQGGCKNCRGVVTVQSKTGEVIHNVEFYALGHFARFVQPGAFRIDSTCTDQVLSAAFLNPDQSKVVIVLNRGSQVAACEIVEGARSFRYDLPPRSSVTFQWRDDMHASLDNTAFDSHAFVRNGGIPEAWTRFGLSEHLGQVRDHNAGGDFLRIGFSENSRQTVGVWQGVTVAAGEQVAVHGRLRMAASDVIRSDGKQPVQASVKLEFYAVHGAKLQSQSYLGEATTELTLTSEIQGLWQVVSLNAKVPDQCVEARVVVSASGDSHSNAIVDWDDVELHVSPRLSALPVSH